MDISQFSSSNVTELAKAMLKIQQFLVPVIKDAENPFVKNKYATLNAVMTACRDVLSAHSVWVTQYPVPVEGNNLGLVTKLVHAESGEWQASCMVMPLAKSDPQGYGSALTYARRYALATLVGLVTELDDDAELAMGRPFKKPPTVNRGSSVRNRSAEPKQQQQGRQGSPKAPLSLYELELSNLPRLDGVTYQNVQAKDGRTCFTASGNTKAKRPMLKEAGFRWDNSRKVWWKYASEEGSQ